VNTQYEQSYFFDAGLYFECLQCGACCTGTPGTIYVSDREIDAIRQFLAIPAACLIQDHLYAFRDSYSIREHADGRCHFYEDGCRIYPVRPHQCRTYPFWLSNLRSRKAWKKTAAQCPGIGSGRFYDRERILGIVQTTF